MASPTRIWGLSDFRITSTKSPRKPRLHPWLSSDAEAGVRRRRKKRTAKAAHSEEAILRRSKGKLLPLFRRPRLQPWPVALSFKPFSRSQDSEVSWRALRMSPEYREGRNTRFTMGRNPFSTISTSCSASWSAFSQPNAKPGARSVIKRTARS